MLNQAQIIGNMTADAEIKTTPNGHNVATFSLATNRKYKDSTGRKIEETDFHNIVAWNWLADIIDKYWCKGKNIFVQGRLHTRSWDDANGVKRYKTEIIADNIELLGGPNKNAEHDQWDFSDDTQVEPPKPATRTKKAWDEDISLEDIPF